MLAKRLSLSIFLGLVLSIVLSGCGDNQPDLTKKINSRGIISKQKVEPGNTKPLLTNVNGSFSISKDEKILIFIKGSTLYSLNRDTNRIQKLARWAEYPLLSGNGSTVVFIREDHLFVGSLRDKNFSSIDILSENPDYPSISFDGTRLVYEKGGFIYLYNTLKKVSVKVCEGYSPLISNDGKKILYALSPSQLNLLNVDAPNSPESVIESESISITFKAFSGNDKYIVYLENGMAFLYEVDTKKKGSLPISFVAGGPIYMSEEGDKIVWTETKGDGSITILDLNECKETKIYTPACPGDIYLSPLANQIYYSSYPVNAFDSANIYIQRIKK